MPESVSIIRIHVSSPADVEDEVSVLAEVVVGLNRELTSTLRVRLELVRWEESAVPGVGPQELINRQIPPGDIFIGILWTRFGSPSVSHAPGTEEEITRAVDSSRLLGRPKVLLYFCERPIKPGDVDVAQMSRVRSFRQAVSEALLHRTFVTQEEFREAVGRDLRTLLHTLAAEIHPAGRVPRVFYSYAHEDAALREELAKHLRVLERKHIIESWYDNMIAPGAEWSEAIAAQLEKADIVVLLVSSDFLDSDYCYTVEMKRALERHGAGEVCVVPVILLSALWEESPLSKLRALPKDARPVTLWADRDEAWVDVARGIRNVATSLANRQV